MRTQSHSNYSFRSFSFALYTLVFLILPGVSITIAGAQGLPYDVNEVQKMRAFLESQSMMAGKTNGDLLGVDMNNPGTWAKWGGNDWFPRPSALHAVEIQWKHHSFAGSLDISGFQHLGYFVLECNGSSNFNSITISNSSLGWGLVLSSVMTKELRITNNEGLGSIWLDGKIDVLTIDQPKLGRLFTSTLGNNLISLDKFPKLGKLDLSGCKNLTNINLATLPSLEELSLSGTSISHLDVTASPNLKGLALHNMPTLQTIKLKKDLTGLYVDKTALKEIDITGMQNLIGFQCTNNTTLTSLKITNKPMLEGGITLGVEGNSALRYLEISGLPTLKYLSIKDNEKLEMVVLKEMPLLSELSCIRNGITSLDVSGLPSLISLAAFDNQLTKFNATGRVFNQLNLHWGNKLAEVSANVGGHKIHLKAYGKGGYVMFDAGPSFWEPYGFQMDSEGLPAPYNTMLEKVEGTGFPPKHNDYSGGFLFEKDIDATFYFKAEVHFLNYFGDEEGDLPDEDEGEWDSDANLNHDSRVGIPFKLPAEYPLPSKTGFEIKGWYTDSTLTHEWNFEKDTLKGELILYPRWIPKGMPVVLSVMRQSPTTENTTSNKVTYLVAFSKTVSGIDISDFTLKSEGTVTGKIASVSAAFGNSISVEVNAISGTGTLSLDVKNSGTGIVDGESNPLSGGFAGGETYHFGPPTGVDNFTMEDKEVRVYPNPTSGNLHIETAGNAPVKMIEVFNLQGKQVLQQVNPENNLLNLADFRSGIYFLKIHTASAMLTRKIVKSGL